MPKGLKLTYKRVVKRPLQKVFKRPVLRSELIIRSAEPVVTLNRLVRSGDLSLVNADKVIRHTINDRHDVFMHFCSKYRKIESEELRIVTSLYCKDHMGITFDPAELEAAWDRLLTSDFNLDKRNELYFLTSAVKAGSLSLVRKIIDEAQQITAETLPSRHKIGLLRLAANDTESDYQSWRRRLHLSDLEMLKVIEIDSSMGVVPAPSHQELSSRLLNAAPSYLHHELRTRILPFFEAHQNQMLWMDCRVNKQARADFISSIAERLREGRPYSLIRLGDGESYAWQDKLAKDHVRIREQRWWSAQLDPERRHRIAHQMLSSIEHADVLGIPSLFRFIRDINEDRLYADHISTLGLIKVLDGVKELPARDRSFTEDRIHQVCFDLDTILELGRMAENVLIVSSLALDVAGSIMTPISDRVRVDYITIPTHAKTADNDLFTTSPKSLPFVYEELNDRLAEKVGPRTLAVIAGGSIGKIFCETARARGGVAIDVGAMADYWVGSKTRMIVDIV